MDHRWVNVAFVDAFFAFLLASGKRLGPLRPVEKEPDSIADIFDVGTGTALIPIELCRRVRCVRVMASDFATAMLDIARYNVAGANLDHEIDLSHDDARSTPFADDMFDATISNTLVHHIANPEPVIREMKRVTRPGGVIFIRDLCRPDTPDEVEQLVQRSRRRCDALCGAVVPAITARSTDSR